MIVQMQDGRVIDTEKSKGCWSERLEFDGLHFISVNTNSKWEHEKLCLAGTGEYYLCSENDWNPELEPNYVWVTPTKAASWLALNGHEMPEDLKEVRP